MTDKLHDECGVFGIYRNRNEDKDAASLCYLALMAAQHRGQISAGVAVNNAGNVKYVAELGLVSEVLTPEKIKDLNRDGKGDMAIGHVRYSPSKECSDVNSQPLVMQYAKGSISIVNNGRLANRAKLKSMLEDEGIIFQTDSDAEIIAYMVARERLKTDSVEAAVSNIMPRLEGAYSFVMMSPHKMIAVRDPKGFRPLCLGKIDLSYCIASESCQIDTAGGSLMRDVKPGEIVIIDNNGIKSLDTHCGHDTSFCVFEYVYFARPDSVINGLSVHMVRQNAGKALAKEHPVDADIVIGIPDSGLDAALGYSYASGIPYEMGFIKNKYIGRTFIQSSQKQREKSVNIKLNILGDSLKGKRVIVIDDSIVRGTTIKNLIREMRKAGAEQVHVRISSPPFINICYYGTDISSKDNLAACRMTLDEIRDDIGADSLGYLSLNSLREITEKADCNFCDACFTGNYPTEIPDKTEEDKYAQKIED